MSDSSNDAKTQAMPGRILALVRAAFVVGIMACAVLENDYRRIGEPAFCGVDSPCFKLRVSPTGRSLAVWLAEYHLTLPQVGLLGLLVLLVVSFFVRTRTYLQAFASMATLGGAGAAYLIYVQAKLHTFCPYCMTVDTSTLIAAVASLVLLWALPTEKALEKSLASSFSPGVTFAWGLTAALATGAPYVWAENPAIPLLPKQIAEMQVPGKVTIVSITDFECPYCRQTAPTLTTLRARPDVAFRRIMAPLPFHAGAEPAALAYLCAPEDKANDLAEALYAADPALLTPDGVRGIAADLGMDPAATKTCMESDETKAHLASDRAIFEAIGGEGLPTTFVGRYEIVGADIDKIKRTAPHANERPLELPPWLLFVLVGAATSAAFAFAWMRAGRADSLRSKVPTT